MNINKERDEYRDIPPLAKRFLVYLLGIRGKSEKTVQEYYYDLRTFFRYMKCRRDLADFNEFNSVDTSDINLDFISSITIDDLYDFLMYVSRKRANSANSMARKVSTLKSFFNYLTVKAHLLEVDITKELDPPKLPKALPRYLSLDESRNLLESVDGEYATRDYAIITLFLNCGMRLSELVGININDIKEDTLTVIGKGNKERTIYLNNACRRAIEAYMAVRPKDGVVERKALFLSERKQRISNSTVYKMVQRCLSRAGLDIHKYSPHKLRHTAATLMYKHGNVDVRALQEILGHEQLSTTQIYTHVDEAQLRDAIDKNPLANEKPKNEQE
ncbi:MAG: tyrosine recombinase XerC [Clostridia bacterium]|nr:tyrosine recombinase XerC [Clostridia bacterium]